MTDHHLSTTPRWRSWAACAHDPTPAYFTPTHPTACDRCPAAEPCLWTGLAIDQALGYAYGHWGGASAARRRRIAEQLGDDVAYQALAREAAANWRAPQSGRAAA